MFHAKISCQMSNWNWISWMLKWVLDINVTSARILTAVVWNKYIDSKCMNVKNHFMYKFNFPLGCDKTMRTFQISIFSLVWHFALPFLFVFFSLVQSMYFEAFIKELLFESFLSEGRCLFHLSSCWWTKGFDFRNFLWRKLFLTENYFLII